MTGAVTKYFQIAEPDLAALESTLPRLQDALGEAMNRPDVQVMVEQVKDVLSNVRWNYGPYSGVKRITPREDE